MSQVSRGVSGFNNSFATAFAAASGIDLSPAKEKMVDLVGKAIDRIAGVRMVDRDPNVPEVKVVYILNRGEFSQALWHQRRIQTAIEEAVCLVDGVDALGIESMIDGNRIIVTIPVAIAATVAA